MDRSESAMSLNKSIQERGMRPVTNNESGELKRQSAIEMALQELMDTLDSTNGTASILYQKLLKVMPQLNTHNEGIEEKSKEPISEIQNTIRIAIDKVSNLRSQLRYLTEVIEL